MENIETIAMKVVHAYEDLYFEKEKRVFFDAVLRRYLPMVDPEAELDLYEAAVTLGRKHPPEFAQMIRALKERSLFPE